MYPKANTEQFYKIRGFIDENKHLFHDNMQKLIDQKRVVPRATSLVLRTEFTPGGTVDLFDGVGASSSTGTNDYDGKELTNGRNIIGYGLTINCGIATTGTDPGAVQYTTALPPAVRNGNFYILQNENVLRRFSIAEINEHKSTDGRFLPIESFLALIEQRTNGAKIETAKGVAYDPGAGNSLYIEYILRGFETAVKS